MVWGPAGARGRQSGPVGRPKRRAGVGGLQATAQHLRAVPIAPPPLGRPPADRCGGACSRRDCVGLGVPPGSFHEYRTVVGVAIHAPERQKSQAFTRPSTAQQDSRFAALLGPPWPGPPSHLAPHSNPRASQRVTDPPAPQMAAQGPASEELPELAEWTSALSQETFDCSPVKQPLAQVRRQGATAGGSLGSPTAPRPRLPLPPPWPCPGTQATLKDGNTQRVSALGWQAAAAAAAGERAAAPAPVVCLRAGGPAPSSLQCHSLQLAHPLPLPPPGAKPSLPVAAPLPPAAAGHQDAGGLADPTCAA